MHAGYTNDVICRLFFKINFLKQFFQELFHIVRLLESRSGPGLARQGLMLDYNTIQTIIECG